MRPRRIHDNGLENVFFFFRPVIPVSRSVEVEKTPSRDVLKLRGGGVFRIFGEQVKKL